MPHGDLKTNIVTLPTHILKNQQKHAEATGDMSIVLNAIATACKWITNVVRKAELLNVVGITGTTNVQAETQQKLDLLSNEIVINMLKGTQKVCLLISEEDEKSIEVDHGNQGHYCVVFDPLDGSSNIDCGVAVGTIFGIYKCNLKSDMKLEDQVLTNNANLICGGYCMYGSCSTLVIAFNGECNGFTLDPNIGEFVLTHPVVFIH